MANRVAAGDLACVGFRGFAQRQIDGFEHVGRLAGLAQHARYACGTSQLGGVALVVFGGKENDGGQRSARLDAQAANQLIAVHRGHQQVGDDEVGVFRLRELQGLLAITGFDDGVAARAQHSG